MVRGDKNCILHFVAPRTLFTLFASHHLQITTVCGIISKLAGALSDPTPRATIDNTMIKAVARAFRWQKLLENGTYGCLDEIAKAERIEPSFVSSVIRLALLAPDIVEAVLAGKQPASLTLKDLMLPFPVEWAGQRLQFGMKTG